MYYFSLEDRFHSKTGTKLRPCYSKSGIICDYCGKIHTEDPENDESRYIMYEIYDYEDIEPTYYYDTTKHDVDKFEIMAIHQHFHYCQDYESGEMICEKKLIDSIVSANSISQAMYQNRWKVIDQLLDSGTKLEELGYIL